MDTSCLCVHALANQNCRVFELCAGYIDSFFMNVWKNNKL